MRDYRRLIVWQKAHKLVLEIYRASESFPNEERYGLTAQIRRCAVSVAANIAEGYGRSGDRELERFLGIAQGSSSELSYQLLLARDLEYVGDETHERLHSSLSEVQKMLASFVSSVRSDGSKRLSARCWRLPGEISSS